MGFRGTIDMLLEEEKEARFGWGVQVSIKIKQ